MNEIVSFSGKYRFLSNFYESPMVIGNYTFPTLEHAYQAMKSDDPMYWKAIDTCGGPGKAKKLGQLVELRPNWDSWKVTVMRTLLDQKFATPELMQKLLDTGDAHLEEGNTWGDRFWGTVDGKGQNQLGILLMAVRGWYRMMS